MDKTTFENLEELSNTTYRIAMYLVFFTLGLQLACYLMEKHAHELLPQPVVLVPGPCEECEKKRKEKGVQEHGRSEQNG